MNTNNPAYSSLAGVLFNLSQTTLIEYPQATAGSYTIPSSVISISDWAFDNSSLTSVTIPNGVTSIGTGAFNQSVRLTSVTIPASVTNIGYSAFDMCYRMTNLTIANGVTSIGYNAFAYCWSLTSVMIPASVTNIGDIAFENCSGLTAITVNTNNPAYISVAGVLFNRTQTTLIQYPAASAGTSYTISNSVTSIGDGAFSSCSRLASITIPASVTNVGDYAFQGCTSLTSITIPASVTSIGYAALNGCSSLTSVTIPNMVTSLGVQAFEGCTKLANVFFTGNAPTADVTVFLNDNNATVYYLPGTKGWSSPFAGRPAVLWNPVIQTGGTGFGVQNNQFGFNITGTANIPVVVEACTNLSSPVWLPLTTNTLVNGSYHFNEPFQPNRPARFYGLGLP